MQNYRVIDKTYTFEQSIKKSKFVAYLIPISSILQVDELLENLKKEHKKATHFCYAYVLNKGMLEKCSDDKEPSGTAGKPMLNILKLNKLTDCIIVVVRYFGGIKLGAGGLLRAYSGACSGCVSQTNNSGDINGKK